MRFSPRPYQSLGIRHIIENPRCGLWAGMGMGKTGTVLESLLQLDLCEQVFPALVVAPLRVATSTWPDEVTKWQMPLRVVPITGSAIERRAALLRPAEINTINYENLPWLIETVGEDWRWPVVICDESTKLKGFRLRQGTIRAKALARVAHNRVRRFINLTGTPAPNGLIDLWGQTWFIDSGARLGRSFNAFQQRWFTPSRVGSSAHAMQWRSAPHAQDEIQAKLKDICLTLDPRDWFDLREPIHTVVTVRMPGKALAIYAEMEKQMFAEIAGHEVEALNAAAKTMKCLQIANGAAYINEAGDWEEIHDAKIEALQDIMEEAAGAPILCAYQFKSDLARILKAIPTARVLDKDPQTIRDWNAGNIPLLLAHPASAGHGLNLQDGGHHMVFFGHWWNLEERLQIIERIGPVRQMQSGHDRPVWIYDIVAEGTVDTLVLLRHQTKADVQDLLMQAMKETTN